MKKRSGNAPADPYRKARFREIAREIIAKDRYNRKHGLSVDTAGAIANALERAYREGTHDGEHGPAPVIAQPESGPMEWALIPPRPRDAFWTICLFTLSRGDRSASGGRLVPAITERGTPGWMLDLQERTYEKLFGDRTIAPLVRLGLIEVAADVPAHRVVSKRGEETWGQFVQRGGQYLDDLTNL